MSTQLAYGEWTEDGSAREIAKEALGRVHVLVANMTEYMKLCRPEHSWLHAFTAFRLPSPLSASGEAESVARASVTACLRRIAKEAKLPWRMAFNELKIMLPRAETYYLNGFHTRAAWGARGGGVARIHERPPPRGAVSRLENIFWQSGTALSATSRDSMPPAGTAA